MSADRVAALLLALVALGFALAWWFARTRVARGNRRRLRHAQRGERDAEAVLGAAGFMVVDRQATVRFALEVDGDEVEATCRADLLVRDADGDTWVAEVKTGERATSPTRPQTRRQLLEYALLFEVVGVLLVDMEAREVHRVRFPFLEGA